MGLFSRKTDSERKIVTLAMLRREISIVEREYDKLGLFDDKIDEIEIILVPLGRVLGYIRLGEQLYIAIPMVSIGRIRTLMAGSNQASLRDTLRHELAHGLAETHRGLIRSSKYRQHFGAAYHESEEQPFDPKMHVSPYASTDPAEDFAEVVRCYVKSRGVIPRRWVGTAIQTKWDFIHELAEAISDDRRLW